MQQELDILKKQYEVTEDFLQKMELEGLIQDLEVRLNQRPPNKPIDSEFECIGCSS